MPKSRLRYLLLIALTIALLFQPLKRVWAAVVLNYFKATSQGNGILLEWQTSSETRSSGFYIQRSTKQDTEYIRLNIYFLSDSETGEGVYYSYLDDQVNPGTTYYYKLEAIDMDGTSTFYGPVSAGFLLGTSTPTSVLTPTQTVSGPISTSTPVTTLFLTRTPTPTRTGTISSPLIPSITPSQTITGTVSGKPTVTPTLEPLPTFEYLFPASTATSIPSKTPSPTIISAQEKVSSTAPPAPLSPRHVVLLGIILLLWAFLSVFLVLLLRILFQNAFRVEDG